MRVDDVDLDRDRILVEAWQAGDLGAFDELYRLYFDRIRGYCRRRVSDRAEADDIAQEAFIRALKALPTLSGERRFYPWLTVIASRLCIDHHRKQDRVQPADEIDLGSVDDGHDARYALQADLEHLDRALHRLGPRHVEVLDLRERQGLTYHEIAGALGVPHSTVEALLFRARKALRREFAAVSAERLAALPGIGWLLAKGRRLAVFGPDAGAIGGALAAGAVAVALIALPADPGHAPSVVAAGPPAAAGTTAAVATASAPPPIAAATPALGADEPTGDPHREPVARIRPLTDDDARTKAAAMPIFLDLGDTGAGIDPSPILDPLADALRSLP